MTHNKRKPAVEDQPLVVGFRSLLIAFALAASFVSCAVPVAPTGGPVDKEPASVLSLNPQQDEINVPTSTRSIRFTFSEYMNESSFGQAFSLSPEPATPPKISWRRRAAIVALQEDLVANTTYVLTLDNRLRDANGVSSTGVSSFAFSTGPQISRGKISGTVINGLDGSPLKSADVFAYPFSDSLSISRALPERPRYRTQTDESGAFTFDYLTLGEYLVIAAADRNNNRAPDELETVAVGDTLLASATESDSSRLRLYSFVFDTESPETRRLRTLSSSRLAVRFSEAIHPVDMSGWAVLDSVTRVQRSVFQAYVSAVDNREVFILTEPLSATRHQVTSPSLPDSAGNFSATETLSFTPGLNADTSGTRILGYLPPPSLEADSISYFLPGRGFGIDLNQFYDLERQPGIALFDALNNQVAFVATTTNGRSFDLVVDAQSRSGQLRIEIMGSEFGLGDTTLSHYFAPLVEDDLGSLSGIAQSNSNHQVVIEAYQSNSTSVAGKATADSSGHFEIGNLLPGNYRFRIIDDANGNSEWDAGTLDPLLRSESLLFTPDTLTVRAKWESVYPDTLRVGKPRSAQSQ